MSPLKIFEVRSGTRESDAKRITAGVSPLMEVQTGFGPAGMAARRLLMRPVSRSRISEGIRQVRWRGGYRIRFMNASTAEFDRSVEMEAGRNGRIAVSE